MPVMTVNSTGLFSTTHHFSYQGGTVGRLAVPCLRVRGVLKDNLGHQYELRGGDFVPLDFELREGGNAMGKARIRGRPDFFAEFIYEGSRFALSKRPGGRFDLLDESKNRQAAFQVSGLMRQEVAIDGVRDMSFPLLAFIYFVIHAYYRRYVSIQLFSKIL
jgi:hypothetical protein